MRTISTNIRLAWEFKQAIIAIGQSWRMTLRAIFLLTGVSLLAECLDEPYDASSFSLMSSYAFARDNAPVLLSNADSRSTVDNSTFNSRIEKRLGENLDIDDEEFKETKSIQVVVPQSAARRLDVENRLSQDFSEASAGLNESLISMAGSSLSLESLSERKQTPALVEPWVSHAWLSSFSSEKQSKHRTQGESQMANIFSASNSEELMNALASAKGGDTIELAGGDYGDLTLKGDGTKFNFDSAVTIVSANLDNQAVFSGLAAKGTSNLKFDNLIFDYNFKEGDPGYLRPFSVSGSDNITFSNSLFSGDVAEAVSEVNDNYGTGFGLSVTDSRSITLESNHFETWGKGATFMRIDGLNVIGNEITDVREDGMNFIQVQNVIIEDNYIHNFRQHQNDPGHQDMIQFWTSNTTAPSTDVVIRGNILDIGDGVWTQSIFMRNDEVDKGLAGSEMFYQNILIEDNTIYNAHTHGITVGETDGLVIRNNSILQAEGEMHGLSGGVTIPKINLKRDSTSVVIEGNVVDSISGYENQLSWSVSENFLIQPSDYGQHFITSTSDIESGLHNFIVLPNGVIEQLDAGSSHIQFPDTPDALTPFFQVHSDPSSSQALVLDASLTVGPLGFLSESEADFLWSFGDGSTATGRIVNHEFASPGHHDVTLTVVAKDGTTAQTQFTAGIAGDGIVQFDSEAGIFESLAYGEETALDVELPLQKTADGYALKLGGEGSSANIPSSALSQFFGTHNFEMSMSLKADSAVSRGEVARIHTSFVTSVDQSGNLRLEFFLDDGSPVRMASEGLALNDGVAHDVAVRFDGEAGFAEILIDGQVVASESVSGALGGDVRSLMFGNPWGKQNFDGQLSDFTLSAASSNFTIYDGEAVPVSSTETEILEKNTSTTSPESDSALTESEEESALPEPLLNGGYQLDFASVATSDTVEMHDDAHLVETQDGPALSFDGKKDFVKLGRLTEFEASQKLAFSVDFVSDNADGGTERLVWNHVKLGLALEGDGLRVHAGNNDDFFWKGFKVDGLGLNDGNRHTAIVMVDAEADRLQVVVNDVLVLDERGTDFDFVGAGGDEWGWSLGTAWNRWFEGEVHEFQVSDDFEFVESAVADDGSILA